MYVFTRARTLSITRQIYRTSSRYFIRYFRTVVCSLTSRFGLSKPTVGTVFVIFRVRIVGCLSTLTRDRVGPGKYERLNEIRW